MLDLIYLNVATELIMDRNAFSHVSSLVAEYKTTLTNEQTGLLKMLK